MTSREDIRDAIIGYGDESCEAGILDKFRHWALTDADKIMDMIDDYTSAQIEGWYRVIDTAQKKIEVRKRAAKLASDLYRDLGREVPEDIRRIADE